MATQMTLFPSFGEGLVELPASCVRTEHASLTPPGYNVAGYTFISIRNIFTWDILEKANGWQISCFLINMMAT